MWRIVLLERHVVEAALGLRFLLLHHRRVRDYLMRYLLRTRRGQVEEVYLIESFFTLWKRRQHKTEVPRLEPPTCILAHQLLLLSGFMLWQTEVGAEALRSLTLLISMRLAVDNDCLV